VTIRTLKAHQFWGIPGGGYVQSIAHHPTAKGVVAIGGDVWGPGLSTDAGATFDKFLKGLWFKNQLNVASVVWSRHVPGRLFLGTTDGFIFADAAAAWAEASSTITWGGNSNVPNVGGNKPPRSSGHLIDDDPTDGTLAGGSFANGVYRSSDGGATWTQFALAGAHVRHIWIDRDNPNRLWVAVGDEDVITPGNTTHWNGLYYIDGWKTVAVGTAPTRTSLPPRWVNKINWNGPRTRMYATCHKDGVWRSTDGGTTWSQLAVGQGTALTDGISMWAAIGIRTDAITGADIVIVGCGNTQKPAGHSYQTMWRSADSGSTWTCVTDPAATHVTKTIYGTVEVSVLDTIGYKDVTVGGISPDPFNIGVWLTSGGGMPYRSDDDGLTWAPAAKGVMSVGGPSVLFDPNRPGRVYASDVDNILWGSDDNGDDVTRIYTVRFPSGIGNPHPIAIGPDGRFYMGAGGGLSGGNSHTAGHVYSHDDPMQLTDFADEGYAAAAGGASAPAVRGMVVMEDAGQLVIVAFVDNGGGVWRGVRPIGSPPGCTWTHLGGLPSGMFGTVFDLGEAQAVFSGSTIFVYDPNGTPAIYRSLDKGLTWQRFWTTSEPPPEEGILALTSDAHTLFVRGATNTWRIPNASTPGSTVDGAQLTPVAVLTQSALVALDENGDLWAVVHPTATSYAAIKQSTDLGTSWEDHTTEAAMQKLAHPTSLVAQGGFLLTGGSNGATVGQYLGASVVPTLYIADPAEGEPYPTVQVDLLALDHGAATGFSVIDYPGPALHWGDETPATEYVGTRYSGALDQPRDVTFNLYAMGWTTTADMLAGLHELQRWLRKGCVIVAQNFDEPEPHFVDVYPGNVIPALVRGQDHALNKVLTQLTSPDGYPITVKAQPFARRPVKASVVSAELNNQQGRCFVRVPSLGSAPGLAILHVTPKATSGAKLVATKLGRRSHDDLDEFESQWTVFAPADGIRFPGTSYQADAASGAASQHVARQLLTTRPTRSWRCVIAPTDPSDPLLASVAPGVYRLLQSLVIPQTDGTIYLRYRYGYAEADPTGHTDTLPYGFDTIALTPSDLAGRTRVEIPIDLFEVDVHAGQVVIDGYAWSTDGGENLDWDVDKLLPGDELQGSMAEISWVTVGAVAAIGVTDEVEPTDMSHAATRIWACFPVGRSINTPCTWS
jgi:hypothetical protein